MRAPPVHNKQSQLHLVIEYKVGVMQSLLLYSDNAIHLIYIYEVITLPYRLCSDIVGLWSVFSWMEPGLFAHRLTIK